MGGGKKKLIFKIFGSEGKKRIKKCKFSCTTLQNRTGKILNEPHYENRSSGFPTRSDTKRATQAQKIARGLKFCI